ncbi:MAG: conjugal transfer protein [Solirubrobacterales bacterium]|nr:conjugal transfer protein [Solirubrobacterales bacterium]
MLLRGVGAIVASDESNVPITDSAIAGRVVDDRVASVAVRFARGYFTDPRGVARHSTPTRHDGPNGSGPGVAQAEVSGARQVAPDVSVVTVACELLSGQVKSLAIPIRDDADELSVIGVPYLVAGSSSAAFEPERGAPLSGSDSEAISKLVTRFIGTYASTARPSDLVYFVSPGSTVAPLGGFDLVGRPDVAQLDDGDTTRTIAARARLKDQATGVTYPVRYRLDLVKRKRWFVADVQGAVR